MCACVANYCCMIDTTEGPTNALKFAAPDNWYYNPTDAPLIIIIVAGVIICSVAFPVFSTFTEPLLKITPEDAVMVRF